MSYHASIFTNVELDPLTLHGNHRPGIRDQEPSDSHQFANLQSFLEAQAPQAANTASRPLKKEDLDRAQDCHATDPPIHQTNGSTATKHIQTYAKHQKSADQERATNENDTKGLTLAFFFTGNTYEHHRQVEFSINKLQPFMYFPIGTSTEPQDTSLRGLYDTSGCCNMGWLQYHLEIAKRFPYIVKQVIGLEQRREEQFSIGGIDGSVFVTHIIEYYIRYTNNQGAPFSLRIGLVHNFPINTLFGLPFIIKAQLTLNLHQMVVTSDVFQDEFEIKLERNTRTPIEAIAHSQGHNNTKTFATRRRSILPPVL